MDPCYTQSLKVAVDYQKQTVEMESAVKDPSRDEVRPQLVQPEQLMKKESLEEKSHPRPL